MTRRDGSRMFPVVVFGVAGVLALSGCGHFGILKPKPGSQRDETGVDTSLSALRKDQGPVAADPDEINRIPEDTSTRARVEESARLIEGYFRELDAASRARSDAPALEPERVALGPSEGRDPDPVVRDGSPTIDERPDPESTGFGDGFSLSAAMNERADNDEARGGEDRGGEDRSGEGQGGEGQGGEGQGGEEDTGDGVEGRANADGVSQDPEPASDPVPVDPEVRKAELVTELVEVLTTLARDSDNPGAAAIDLAALESMGAGTLEGLHEQGVLSNSEMATLSAAREVLRSISRSGSIASPGEVSEVLDRVKSELDERAGLRIKRAELCTSVQGFGRYEPFATNEFVAGAAQDAIVYTEVDRFGYRDFTGTDGEPRYEVEL